MEEYSKFIVCEDNMKYVEKSIDTLNKKAKKLNLPEIQLIITNPTYEEYTKDKKKYIKKFYDVAVIGEAPIINGWIFVASISTDQRTSIIRQNTSVEIEPGALNQYREHPTHCEHCNSNRRRKNTYIVKHIDSGSLKQVGSTCIRDFTGHMNPQKILAFYDSLHEFKYIPDFAKFEGNINYGNYYEFNTYMSFVAYCTRVYGFVKSRIDNDEQWPTKSHAMHLLNEMYKPLKRGEDREMPEAIDNENYKKAIKYFLEDTFVTTKGDFRSFVDNVKVIIDAAEKDGMIREKDVAYIAPLVQMYFAFEKKTEESKITATSEFIGEVGKRQDFVLTLKKFYTFEGAWGASNIYVFNDETGNVFIWKTGAYLEKDETYTIKGTIKEHKIFRDVKQTIISRGKVIK